MTEWAVEVGRPLPAPGAVVGECSDAGIETNLLTVGKPLRARDGYAMAR